MSVSFVWDSQAQLTEWQAVAHGTARIATAVEHIRQLLAPNGRLLLHEIYPGMPCSTF